MKKLQLSLRIFTAFAASFVLLSSQAYAALTPVQLRAIDSGARYVNTEDSCTVQQAADATPTGGSDNVDIVFNYLTSKGLTPNQAVGLLVNLKWESGVEPKKVQGGAISETVPMDSRTGYGIAQWTPIDRKNGLIRYSNQLNLKVFDINLQARYLWKELSTNTNYGLKDLKTASSVQDAARVVLTKFERPKDQSEAHLQVRITNAKDIIDKYKDAAGSTTTASVTTGSGGCVCSAEGSAVDNGKVVVLDPGHSINKTVVDSQTGLNDVDSANTETGERQAAWDVVNIAKNKLEDDGYKVILTKKSEAEYAGMRDRATIADQAKADIAVSIHGDPGLGHDGEIYVQKDGLFRGSGAEKVSFNNPELAKKSQQYADAFKSAREKAQGGTVVIKDNSFNGRDPIEPGNIPLVMLFSQSTPWVYNETKMSFDNDKYAKGIVDGVEKALGSANASSSSAADTSCGDSASGSDAITTAFNYAYADGRKTLTMKDSYALAVSAAKRKGEYIGGINYPGVDCGGFITRVMRNSGADKSYNSYEGPTSQQQKYMDDNPDKYQKIGAVNNVSKLEPGDIAITDNHTYMYVGAESEHPDFKGNAASASLDDYAPTANTTYFADSHGVAFTWYRLIK